MANHVRTTGANRPDWVKLGMVFSCLGLATDKRSNALSLDVSQKFIYGSPDHYAMVSPGDN